MKPDPIKNDVRKERKKRTKTKRPDRACIFCGNKETLDDHHLVGRGNDKDLTAPICKSSHSTETDLQTKAGVDLSHGNRPFMESLESILRALGLVFSQLGDKCREWADGIAAHLRFLDTTYPGWCGETT